MSGDGGDKPASATTGHHRGRNGSQARRPSGFSGLGRSLPIALLLVAVITAGFGAFQAYRSQRSHTTVTASLLKDYGGFAAFTYQQRSSQLLLQALQRRLAVARNNPVFRGGHATEACLVQLLETPYGQDSCDFCVPEILGGFSFFTQVGKGPSESVWAGEPPGKSDRARIVERMQAHAREAYDPEWPFAVVHSTDTPARILAYTLITPLPSPRANRTERTRFDAAGDPVPGDSLIYGVELDHEGLAKLFAYALNKEVLLPPSVTRERPNNEVIAVQILGPDEQLLFASSPKEDLPYGSQTDQRSILGGGVIRASVLPEVADQLIIGGLPRDRTPLFVLIFGIAGALAVLAIIQLRREDRLALLRQDFVASVSHELRTPLAQVRLFTETLRLGRTRTEKERDWALENIDRESHRLANLVDNILHFSRSERGVLTIDPGPGDLAPAVREAISSLSRLLPRGKARFETRIDGPLPAEIDPEAIRQVVLNLLDNAVRYGPAGQTIQVTGTRSAAGVRVSVEDQGPGVPTTDRERIFEPFKRGDPSIGTVVVGSGIGLSVVREIITAHKGRTWVDSGSGGGARFNFELPLLNSARLEQFPSAREGASSESGAA